ncbi:TldD/PmbA family protein [Candidatus Riflebacteria bacterium]
MNYLDLAEDVVKKAKKLGANEAEVYIDKQDNFSIEIMEEEIDKITQSSQIGLGLRLFLKGRSCLVHTTDFAIESLTKLIEESITLARMAQIDEYMCLPESEPFEIPDELKIFDSKLLNLSPDSVIERVKKTNLAARQDTGFEIETTLCTFSSMCGEIFLANSKGFQKSYPRTTASLFQTVVAKKGNKKHRGCFHSSQRSLKQLPTAEDMGKQTALQAERILGARTIKSKKMSVIFDPDVASFLWMNVFEALNCEEVLNNRSFLIDKIGKPVASPIVTIRDDARLTGGCATVPWDAEGTSTSNKIVIEKGILKNYFYDTYNAGKAGKKTTGNSRRQYNTLPFIRPTNLYLQRGETDLEEMISSLQEGLFVTFMIGMGVDHVTGTFSQGAEGIYIRDGAFAFPVEEFVVSGNMFEMMQGIEMVGTDLEFHGTVSSPSILINEMSVSGK